jgi:group II intron reverse transcriptase/maturase
MWQILGGEKNAKSLDIIIRCCNGLVPVNVGELQQKISQRATQAPSHRFEDLYSLLYNGDWLSEAQRHVRRNTGSKTAGIDGITMRGFEERLEANLQTLQQALRAGTFEPLPVRRRTIREVKRNGRIKHRRLGIPAIQDRIVQEAVRMALEPIYEADFSKHSYGFRPNRCTMDAVTYIGKRLVTNQHTYGWVIEGDITSFFDTLNQKKLMQLLRKRIKDQKMLDLIWKFLRAGVMERGKVRHTVVGTPQGGIASPLLANIYLHELDIYVEQYTNRSRKSYWKRKGYANFLYVRYCDDFVVLCDGNKQQAEAMKQELTTFLAEHLKLDLSQEKTKVTHVNDGFEFLGYLIERGIGTSGKLAPRIRIPKSALDKAVFKVEGMLSGSTDDSVKTKIQALNRFIRGWCHYYQMTSSPSVMFKQLEHKLFWSMGHWLGKKYKLSMPKVRKKFGAGNTFGTATVTLLQPSQFKAKWHKARVIPNPYLSPTPQIERENFFDLEKTWTGREERPGTADLKEGVYRRDSGKCGRCGLDVPWTQAHLDHIKPRATFKDKAQADVEENLWILHDIPCHREKTKQDLQAVAV